MNLLHKCSEAARALLVLFFAVVMCFAFLKIIIEPLAPLITALVVLLLTFYALSRWTTAIMSVGGITLYLASWPASSAWGTALGVLVFSLGFLIWLSAVYKACVYRQERSYTITKLI